MLARLITNRYEVYDANLQRINENPLFPSKLFYLVLRIKNIFAKKYKKTLFREWLFDYFASKNLSDADCIYLDAERFPLVVKVARDKAITTICYQRTAHSEYISSVLTEETKKREYYTTGYLDKSLYLRRRGCVDHVDYILAHSKFVRDTDIASGRSDNTIKVIYGCVDVNTYHSLEMAINQQFVVLFVGTDPLLKGLFYLLDCWREIQSKMGDACLWIAGDKPHDYEMRYPDLKNIHFLERQSDMVSLYNRSSILVQPSLADAGPKVITEAMASGLPVIVTNAMGYSEIIEDGINGFIVPARNSKVLAEKIFYCFLNQTELLRMGQAAYVSVKKFTHTYHATQVVEAVRSVIENGSLQAN